MKTKLLIVSLLTVALLLAFTGCSQATAQENLNSAGNMVRSGVDAAEDMVENAVSGTVSTESAGAAVQPTTAAAAAAVTKEEAEAIALEPAGFTADQVSWLHTEYEEDNGVPQYEVDFHQDRWEYEYEIDAETGAILSYDRDD